MPSRLAIVTGTSRGIGAAIAHRLARAEFAVLVNHPDSRSAVETETKSVAPAIDAAGGQAQALQRDVASTDDVWDLFEQVEAAWINGQVVCVNGGIA